MRPEERDAAYVWDILDAALELVERLEPLLPPPPSSTDTGAS